MINPPGSITDLPVQACLSYASRPDPLGPKRCFFPHPYIFKDLTRRSGQLLARLHSTFSPSNFHASDFCAGRERDITMPPSLLSIAFYAFYCALMLVFS
jgi:hypothetical protein